MSDAKVDLNIKYPAADGNVEEECQKSFWHCDN